MIYVFKSGLLEKMVNIYHERNNIIRYFVNIDGSATLDIGGALKMG